MTITIGSNPNWGQIGVEYADIREIAGSLSLQVATGTPSATRRFKCLWDDREEIKDYLLGSFSSATGDVLFYPDSYPGYPQLECYSVSIEGEGVGGRPGEAGDFNYAIITASYNVGGSISWKTRWFATVSGSVETLIVEGGTTTYTFVSDGAKIDYLISPVVPTSVVTIRRELWLPNKAGEALLFLPGKTNTDTVTIGDWLICSPGTLLCESVNLNPAPLNPSMSEVTLNCKYRAYGWNKIFRVSTGAYAEFTPKIAGEISFNFILESAILTGIPTV